MSFSHPFLMTDVDMKRIVDNPRVQFANKNTYSVIRKVRQYYGLYIKDCNCISKLNEIREREQSLLWQLSKRTGHNALIKERRKLLLSFCRLHPRYCHINSKQFNKQTKAASQYGWSVCHLHESSRISKHLVNCGYS